MDGECGAFGREVLAGIWWGSLKEGVNLEDLDIDVREIYRYGIEYEEVDIIDQDQDTATSGML
jgi:hypothetical protein